MANPRPRQLAPIAALMGSLCLALTACTPPAAAKDDTLNVHLTLTPDGTAQATITSADPPTELTHQGKQIGDALFPTGYHLTLNKAHPSVVLKSPNAYHPGPTPIYRLDTRPLQTTIPTESKISLSLTLPNVQTEIRADPKPAPGAENTLTWTITPTTQPPIAEVIMHPRPARWLARTALTLESLLLLTAALILHRRPRTMIPLTTLALATATTAATLFPQTDSQGDDITVSGHLPPNLQFLNHLTHQSTYLAAATATAILIYTLTTHLAPHPNPNPPPKTKTPPH